MPLTDATARNAKPAASTHARLTRFVADQRRTSFSTFAASCDRRCPLLANRPARDRCKSGSRFTPQ
jgi:hypothetical protein